MARQKFDGVVETVRYTPEGEISLVRLYERRGSAFSDYVLIDRPEMIRRIRAGKKLVTGQRVPYFAGTFEDGW